tara:strand:+ start:60 stop:251 length:192 start_codon:yes stop_codon:yes gene_type:complete
MTELKQCNDCREYSSNVKMVPEFKDKENGDAWGYVLCIRCKANRIALKNDDVRVQIGDDREWE